jgi:hypothetical protein
LLSYGPPNDGIDTRRLAASYVDRILRGVSSLVRADEVIE